MSDSQNKPFKKTLLTTALTLATTAQAGIVTDAIDYQYFRDFAENKGKFTVGANRIEVVDKTGASRGQMFPTGEAGMPDLAVTSTNGVSHLIDPQYIASVKHNGGYGEVQFGIQRGSNFVERNFNYLLVDRNDKPNSGTNGEWTTKDDYHIPRLHKLVTETAPIPILRLTGNDLKLLADRERFPYIVRTGAGTQAVRPATGDDISVAGAYSYGIGGNIMNGVTVQNNHVVVIGDNDKQKALNESQYGPLPTMTLGGDSGSPIFAYDAKEKQWVAISVHHAGDGVSHNWVILHQPEFINEVIAGDKVVVENKVKDGRLIWQPSETTSLITSPHDRDLRVNVNLRDASLADDKETRFRNDLNHGKTLHIKGEEGTLRIGGNTHQGAGALYFDNNFTVIGASNETTWQGAGVSVADGKTVHWQVHNPESDRLSKVGSGSLNVSGVGINKGKISVGEGKVLLNQRPDAQGQTQAFSEVHITSGRPTVVLGDDKQVNPDNIVFGFRGGRLDVNGNDLTFGRLRSVDSGAKIVNHNENKVATVNYVGSGWKADDVQVLNWNTRADGGKLGVYQYPRYGGSYIEYFRLKDGANPSDYFPTDGKSNANWEYLGRDNRDEAIKQVLDSVNGATQIFEGWLGESDEARHNGKLDFVYRPQHSAGRLVLNGGMNLNGNVTVANGTLMLSGSPIPHAYDHLNKTDVVKEDEWVNSHFVAKNFNVTNGTLLTSRDVKTITGDIHASQNARVNLGFVNGETDVCYRSDFTGVSHCQNNAIADNLVKPLTVNGNATVQDQAHLTVVNTTVSGSLNAKNQANITLKNKAIAKEVNLQDTAKLNFANTGDILNTKVSGTRNSQVSMQAGSHWTLPENTTIGHLFGDIGSEITLNPAGTPQVFQQLTLNGDLSGNVKFNLASDLGEGKADKVVVHGYANGKHELAVRHTGAEAKVDELTLVELKHGGQEAKDVAFTLQGGHVDAGALRYTLENDPAKRYYLFNREKADEIKAKREEEARKAAEAEAQAKQDLADAIAARERAEKARAEAEEALRQAIANGSVSAQALLDAQRQAEEARRLADQAQADKTRAENLLAEKERELAAANTAKTQAENQIQAAEAEKTRLQNQLNEANTAKQNAEQAQAQAESDKAAAQQQAQVAEAAKTAAEAAAQTAAQKQQQAENDKVAAQAALAEAERLKNVAEQALADAQADGGKALADAQQTLDDVKKQIADKEQELANAKAILTEAKAQKAQAEQQAYEAQTALIKAQADLVSANEAKDQAITQAERAETAKQTAEQKLGEAITALTQAQADKSVAEQQAHEAQVAKARAEEIQKVLEQAQTAQTQALKETEQALVLAQQAKNQAVLDKQSADAKRQQAQEARDKALSDLATAEQQKAQAQADKAKAEQNLANALRDKQKVDDDLANVQRDLTALQNQKDQLTLELTQANADKAKTQADLANAILAKETAEDALKLATQNNSADVAKLTQDLANANAQILQRAEELKQAIANQTALQAQLAGKEQALAQAQADKDQAEKAKQASDLAKAKAEDEANRQAELARLATIAQAQAQTAQKLAEAQQARQAELTKVAQDAQKVAELTAQNAQTAQKLAQQAQEEAKTARQKAEEANVVLTQANERLQASVNADAKILAQAQADLEKAQKLVDSTNQALAMVEQDLTAKQAQLNQIQEQNRVIEAQLQQEKTLREQAQIALQNAQTAQKLAQQATQEAIQAQNKSETERQEAQAKANEAEQFAKQKQREADEAEQALALATKQLEQTLAQVQTQATQLAKAEADSELAKAQAKEAEQQQKLAEAEAERLRTLTAQKEAQERAKEARQKKQAEVISQYANTALSELSATAHHLHRVGDRIDDRLQRLNGKNSGVWLQTDSEKTKHASDQYRGYEQDSQLTQIGVDNTVQLGKGDLTVGGALNHLRYEATYDGGFKGEGRTVTGTLYGKWHTPSGFAVSGDVTAGQADSQISQHTRTSDIGRTVVGVGVGASQSFHAGGVDIEAYAGVRRYLLGDAKYAITASDGSQAQVTQDDIGIVSHQAGVNVGKTIQTAGGMNVRPSVGVGYRHTNSEATVAINDHALTQKFANEVQIQVGIGVGKGDWELNLQADYAKNNESGSRTSALMGVNWRW